MPYNLKHFISLAGTDIKKHYQIGAGAVKLIKEVFYYQSGSLNACIAAKSTLKTNTGLSKRAVYYNLKILHNKGIICRLRRNIRLTTSFIRYINALYEKFKRCERWSYYSKVKLIWLWRRCGKSVDNLHRKLFGYSDACTLAVRKLHPNNRLLSYDNNNNIRHVNLQKIITAELEKLSLAELKELYLAKLKEFNHE